VTHAQPFYCPYCGESDFTPHGDQPSQFLCSSCARVYSVKFIGLAVAPHSAQESG
jgi:transposase-like protein